MTSRFETAGASPGKPDVDATQGIKILLATCVWIYSFTAWPTLAQAAQKQDEPQVPVVPKELIPPSPALAPEEALRTFRLKPGFTIELVASEPLVEDPVAMAFDPDEGLWVVEMRGFMPNVDGQGEHDIPGRVSYLRDSDGDGRMDQKEIFLDGLVMPRALALVDGGVLVAEPPHLWFCRDTNGDRRCDEKIEVASNYGSPVNPEHTANGLLWAMDNWIYSANHQVRYRYAHRAWLNEPTTGRGQWGISQDNYGRLFFNSNSDQLRADLIPSHYANKNPDGKLAGINIAVATNQATFPIRVTPGVNRGYRKETLRPDYTLATFTAACAPCIYRGETFPEEYQGNGFVCEPSGNLIKRNLIEEKDGILTSRFAYPDSEFLASTDERFRPVNLYTGPDGALYIVDMYHGILQHRIYLTTYLRDQILDRGLQTPIHYGRIYRVKWQNQLTNLKPKLAKAASPDLVRELSHANGWRRDTAQRLLVERNALDVVPALKQLALQDAPAPVRLHALWTLDGLAQGEASLLTKTLADPSAKIRATTLRLAESILQTNANASELRHQIYQRANDSAPEVLMQLALSLGTVRDAEAPKILAELKERTGLVRQLATFSLGEPTPKAEQKPPAPSMTAEEKAQFELGRNIYEIACLVCHQPNGQGQEGLAPPLVASEWLKRPPEHLARIVLHGLRGPVQVKGQTYQLEMPSLAVLDDEQIAAALSFVRREWGPNIPPITPQKVKEVRAAAGNRSESWTIEELDKVPADKP